jgi:hypothetical protein
MLTDKAKTEKRDFEKITYARDMFWQEPEKQRLIVKLLQKIYDLEDEIYNLKQNSNGNK